MPCMLTSATPCGDKRCHSQRCLDERCLSRPVGRCEPARAARLVVCRPCAYTTSECMAMMVLLESRSQLGTDSSDFM